MRNERGVCPVCQQSGIRIYHSQTTEGDEPVLYDHDHQGGDRCEGSGQNPQAVYSISSSSND